MIGDTLADAFMSKTEAIPQAQIDAMTKRLANLEDFVADDPTADLPLDAESIELMLGIDASMIEVIARRRLPAERRDDGLGQGAAAGQLVHAGPQRARCTRCSTCGAASARQLHLFASTEGRSFLVQARRLAAYLQAGLLLPAEEEALTVRATRDALAKLDANPERLLA